MRQFFSFAFLSAISYLCHRVFDKSKWNTKDTAFKVDKSLPRLLPYAVCQIVRFDWNFWWQKYQNHPHVAFRGNNLRPALSGRSKIRPLRRKNTRRKGCGGSANSTYLPSPADAFASLPLRARRLSVVLVPLQAIMRLFYECSRSPLKPAS